MIFPGSREGVTEIVAVEKRGGSLAPFEMDKIKIAIKKAANSAGANYPDETLDTLTNQVLGELSGPIVDIEKIQDIVIKKLKRHKVERFADQMSPYLPGVDRNTLKEVLNHALFKEVDNTPEVYEAYRTRRAFVRRMRLGVRGEVDTTDMAMILEGDRESVPFTRSGLMKMIIQKTTGNVPFGVADGISKSVEFSVFDAYKEILESGKVEENTGFEVSEVLLTELVNLELYKRGLREHMIQDDFVGMRTNELEKLITERGKENANLKANSSEAIGFLLAENVRKKMALKSIFSRGVSEAHRTGRLHLHDLGMPDRVYCSGHSIEYIKKFGLDLCNLDTTSKPASHARTLTGHLNTFLASMQAYYAGALGLGFVNIMYAPYVEGMTSREMKQEAQHLIFSLSQSAFSRGGQTLFLDANVHTGVPEFLWNVPAIGPGGKYMKKIKRSLEEEIDSEVIIVGERKARVNENYFVDDRGDKLFPVYMAVMEDGNSILLKNPPKDKKGRVIQSVSVKTEGEKLLINYEETEFVDEVPRFSNPKNPEDRRNGDVLQPEDPNERYIIYGDYENTAQLFLREMLTVWHEGDPRGNRFTFPKCDLHINANSFLKPEQLELVKYACEIAGDTGDPYFVFDRSAVTLSACCRLRTVIKDPIALKYPESMRFCGFQNVTINLPQAAYRAKEEGKTFEEQKAALFKDVDASMDIAMRAHVEKKEFSQSLMKPGLPLWQLGKIARDGKPYVGLDEATYIIGLVGLNECVHYMFEEQLHESSRALELGLEITNHMYQRTLEYEVNRGLKVELEESPAESATRRLIVIDKTNYPEQTRRVMKGSEDLDQNFYTNSVHLAADAPVDIFTRISDQARFNEMTQAGAIIHAHTGEEKIPLESVLALIKKTYEKTNAAQLAVSPTLTFCNDCEAITRGKQDSCLCGSEDVYSVARIVGYFSRIGDWNKSKLGEEADRRRGNYSLLRGSENGEPYNFDYPEEPMFHVHGKPGCHFCDMSERKISELGHPKLLGAEPSQKHYNLNDERERLESLKQGVSLSAYPTVLLSAHGREVKRWVGTDFTKTSSREIAGYVTQSSGQQE